MDDNKVTLHKDYNYSPKLPDLYEFVGFVAGSFSFVLNNRFKKLPYGYKASTKFPMFAIVGFLTGTALAAVRDKFNASRRIRIEDYMAAHPEDFIEEEPKKYGDILLPWHPVR